MYVALVQSVGNKRNHVKGALLNENLLNTNTLRNISGSTEPATAAGNGVYFFRVAWEVEEEILSQDMILADSPKHAQYSPPLL